VESIDHPAPVGQRLLVRAKTSAAWLMHNDLRGNRMKFFFCFLFYSLVVSTPTLAADAVTLRGTVDGIKNGQLSGWAFDTKNPSASVTVSIYRDGPMGSGALMGSAPTTGMRPDVNAHFNLAGAHGFSWQVPPADRNRPHMWYVYGAGDGGVGQQVNNSPLVYPAITATAMGQPQAVFTYATDRCDRLDIPDQPARAYRDAAGDVTLIASTDNARRAIGKSLDTVTHQCAVIHSSDNDPTFGDFRYHEWLQAPYTRDGKTIYTFMHSEWHAYLVEPSCRNDQIDGWVNAITLAISRDGGASFSRPKNYLVRYPTTPWNNSFSCDARKPTRYGDFSGTNIILKDNYYYKFFQYVTEPSALPQAFGVCVMRTRNLCDASSWEIWDGNGYLRSKTAPCAFINNINDIQSVTYNTYLQLYVATEYIKSRGFFFSVSQDLINWSGLMPINVRNLDTSMTPYPVLLDPTDTSRNFEKTGQQPYLYYTQFHGGLNRDLMRVQIKFSSPAS
jgi:hypothetical protein